MKTHRHVIKTIKPGSIAEEMELEPGDVICQINGQDIEDVFDYHYLMNDTYVIMLVEKKDGEAWELEIDKEYDEDMGVEFEEGLMDQYKSCSNKCIFCFIDQLPKGMRETMYFKDDDSRLSFLQGNYITMTNMKDADLERIIKYKLSPINVSVHTTNPELRCMMLHNRFAGKLLDQMKKLYEHEIMMNGQIVLVKGVNDGAELERTIGDLEQFLPYMESVSIVPIGLTKYRDGLFEAESFTKEDARNLLEQVKRWQKHFIEEYDMHFIHASDEWYIMAGEDIPDEDEYDGYIQLENGVGMVRLFLDEFRMELQRRIEKRELGKSKKEIEPYHISTVTGTLVAPYIQLAAEELMAAFPNVVVDVYPIINHFFGEKITVTGLLTGKDIIEQLSGKDLGKALLLPINTLRSEEDVLLDDLTVSDIEKALQVPVRIVKSNGQDCVCQMLDGYETSAQVSKE